MLRKFVLMNKFLCSAAAAKYSGCVTVVNKARYPMQSRPIASSELVDLVSDSLDSVIMTLVHDSF